MMRLNLRQLLISASVAALVAATTVTALAQSYEFKLGFKALADQIPALAGDPIEEEHYGDNGDSLQQTSTGLMVWRKADNWTTFTNGSRTWVNGPLGLQERANNERFTWERIARVDSTEVITFRPSGARGLDQEGRCWTDSLASGQADAWRCMVENRIYDPCFAVSGEGGTLICGATPSGDGYGFLLRLTEPLPARTVRPSDRPWMMELANGVTCGFMTGATTGIAGERANYGCTDGWFILGDPEPGQIWTANQARIEITSQGPTLLDSAKVAIKTVWR